MGDDRLTATPTMADVARLAGVSKMTVSRALAGGAVSAATRGRIMDAVREVQYVLDAAAGALSSRRSGFVATLVPTLANSNFADTVRGLSGGLAEDGLQVLLGYTDHCLEREEALVRAMLRHRPEAIVLTGGEHRYDTRLLLTRARVLVAETRDVPADPLGLVAGFLNADAAAMMVHHLAERGYRRIGFIGGAPGRDRRGENRRRGYEQAVTELGLGACRIVEHGEPPIGPNHGVAALSPLMERWPDTDAVFCVSDLSATGAVTECHRRGWAIPGRIAVAGFGDFEGAESCWPSPTAVQVDPRGIGQHAARLLRVAMRGQQTGAPQALSVRVVHRDST